MAAVTCSQHTRRGRCQRRVIKPTDLAWRLLSVYRSLRPLRRLCSLHAEQRVLQSTRPSSGEYPWKGRRRELWDFLRSQPTGLWVTVQECAEAVYGDAGCAEIGAVRMLVWRIRQVDKTLIETLDGVGYRLRAEQMTGPTEEQHARAS